MKSFKEMLSESYLAKAAFDEVRKTMAARDKHAEIPPAERKPDHAEVHAKLEKDYADARAYHAHTSR